MGPVAHHRIETVFRILAIGSGTLWAAQASVGGVIRFVVGVSEANNVVFGRPDVLVGREQKVVEWGGSRSTQYVGLPRRDRGAKGEIEALANIHYGTLTAIF